MLIDDVTVTIRAGRGGNGVVSFRHNEGKDKGGPDGGNGGNGGDVYVQGVNDITALDLFQYKKLMKAEDGIRGQRKTLFGRNGEDLIVHLPVGTLMIDLETDEKIEITNTIDPILIAKGGKGGRGNDEFKSATNQAPRQAEEGEIGEEKRFHLILRLIADIGLIGFPNAGKSTLLSVLTNAHPKIANYPFTTLEPNLGVLTEGGKIIADIPGLIEGASKGKGLGIKFLKHIIKTKVLVHCIDSSSEDVLKDYKTIQNEFATYSSELIDKKQLILLTKIDLVDAKIVEKKKKILAKLNSDIEIVSIYDEDSVANIRSRILSFL